MTSAITIWGFVLLRGARRLKSNSMKQDYVATSVEMPNFMDIHRAVLDGDK